MATKPELSWADIKIVLFSFRRSRRRGLGLPVSSCTVIPLIMLWMGCYLCTLNPGGFLHQASREDPSTWRVIHSHPDTPQQVRSPHKDGRTDRPTDTRIPCDSKDFPIKMDRQTDSQTDLLIPGYPATVKLPHENGQTDRLTYRSTDTWNLCDG